MQKNAEENMENVDEELDVGRQCAFFAAMDDNVYEDDEEDE